MATGRLGLKLELECRWGQIECSEPVLQIRLRNVSSQKERWFSWFIYSGGLYAPPNKNDHLGVLAPVQLGQVLKRRVHVFLLKLNKDNQESLWLRVG